MNKAEVLRLIEAKIKVGKVLPIKTINYENFLKLKIQKLKVATNLGLDASIKYVVRSSHSAEDTVNFSNAGKYLSLTNVKLSDLDKAIESVFNSYGELNNEEIVLIQPQLESVKRSGVVFSHDPNTLENYLIDNYVLSEKTDEITSGNSNGFKHVCYKAHLNMSQKCLDSVCVKLSSIINACSEILQYKYIDLEYGVDTSDQLYIFQVRPLVLDSSLINKNPIDFENLVNFIDSKMSPQPFLSGNRTIFGVMPDWNPAEMIGRRPKQLALSLYRELITDSIWAYQRDNYGYKTLRSFPLMVEIAHQPFIDTRVSFNSLLPKGLDTVLEGKLVNHYLDTLEQNGHLHDKVEFEIVLSSWTFELESKLQLLPKEIDHDEKKLLEKALLDLTRNVIALGYIDKDISRINQLMLRQRSLVTKEKNQVLELYWLLEDCKRWGTLPFAGLARAAFISTQIIKSLENKINRPNLLSGFVESLSTVTTQMNHDLTNEDREKFLGKYGHLRPGTYDVASKTYNEAFEEYFKDSITIQTKKSGFSIEELVKLLDENNIQEQLGIGAIQFVEFARKSIYWREQSKFEFTKNLSLILDLVKEIGETYSFNRNDMAYLNIRDLINCYSTSADMESVLGDSINKGKQKYAMSSRLDLPNLIFCSDDIFSFTERDAVANYVTLKALTGAVTKNLDKITGKIVLIEGADPGYDWIFQKGIAGLITAYGGSNSHMAIRCSELGIPAAIGVGDRVFSEISKSNYVYLDCANRKIEYR